MSEISEVQFFCVKKLHADLSKSDNLVYQSLESFVELAVKFNRGECQQDVVEEYVTLSGDCHELLDLLKSIFKVSPKDAATLFKTLTSILVRTTNDLKDYSLVSLSIVAQVLKSAMKSLINFVSDRKRPSRIKLALNLIAAMIAQGPEPAHDVFLKLNLNSEAFTNLLGKSNPKEAEDVRGMFLNVIVILLSIADDNLLLKVVEAKGFLNAVFPNMAYDKPHILVLLLRTFMSKILSNPAITKTKKIHLFNDYTLKFMLKLYVWKSPQRMLGKRKLGAESESLLLDATEEDITSVREAVHEFMMVLCCSYKHGVIFHDSSCGTTGKNQNAIITKLLKSLSNPYETPLMIEFVVSLLRNCPDQRKHYLSHLKDRFKPRFTVSSLKAMIFLKKVVESGDGVSWIFKHGKQTTSKLTEVAKIACVVDVIDISEYTDTIKENNPLVCYYLMDFLHGILKQAKSISDYCSSSHSCQFYSDSELQEFRDKFVEVLVKVLPDVKLLENHWLHVTMKKLTTFEIDMSFAEFVQPTMFLLLSKVLDILTLYQELQFGAFHNPDASFFCLSSSLTNCTSQLDDSEMSALQLQIIDVFSGENSLENIQWNESLGVSPFCFILDIYLATKDIGLISKIMKLTYKIFRSYSQFNGEQWEVEIWLKMMKREKTRYWETLKSFLISSLHLLKEARQMPRDTDKLGCCLQKIASNEKSYSDLICTSICHLKSLTENKKVCNRYVQIVVSNIFHRLQEPHVLFSELCDHESIFPAVDWSYWNFLSHSNTYSKKVELVVSEERYEDLSKILQHAFVSFRSCRKKLRLEYLFLFENVRDKVHNISIEEAPEILWQLLNYIKLEADKIFVKSSYPTAIPKYIEIIKSLLSQYEPDRKEDVIVVEKECSKHLTFHLNSLMCDLLSHPGLSKCFLPAQSHFYLENNAALSTLQDVSNFVFDVLQSQKANILSVDLKNVISTLKNTAIQFFKMQNESSPTNEKQVLFLCSMFERTVLEFSSVFSINDVIVLLECLLFADDELCMKLDPRGCMLSMLLQNDRLQSDYNLLPSNLISVLVSQCIRKDQKKKRRRLLREILDNLLQNHPAYALSIPSEYATSLLSQASLSNLNILEILVLNNPEIQSEIQNDIQRQLQNEELSNAKLLFHVAIQCIRVKEDLDFLSSIRHFILNCIDELFISNLSYGADKPLTDMPFVIKLLVENKLIGLSEKEEIMSKLQESIHTAAPSETSTPVVIEFVLSLHGFTADTPFVPSSSLLQMVFTWMEFGIQTSSNVEQPIFLLPLFEFFQQCIQNSTVEQYDDIFQESLQGQQFIQKILGLAIREPATGAQLFLIADGLIKKLHHLLQVESAKVQKNAVSFIPVECNLADILTDTTGKYKILKEPLIQLLITLKSLNFEMSENFPVAVILAAYDASLSNKDQKILYLLKLYDESGDEVKPCSSLWGAAAMSKYLAIKRNSSSLQRDPTLQVLLGYFQHDLLDYTALNFPLHLPQEVKPVEVSRLNKESPAKVDWAHVYDPRFLFNVLHTVLSPGAFVNCRDFIDSNVLPVIFAALSSYDVTIRAQGYYCLSQFYSHLESSPHGPRILWISLLDSLRNSIEKPNARLSSIITLFMGKAVYILKRPDHCMYVTLYKFLTIKPLLDVGQVPEFYKLFNSNEIEYRVHRSWLFALLAEGMRTSLDFHLCQKRFVFSVLLPYFSSSLCTEEEKMQILMLLLATVRINSSARTLYQAGLLQWLNAAMKSTKDPKFLMKMRTISDIISEVCIVQHQCSEENSLS